MTNEQLVMRIKSGECIAENMLKLWENNKPFIHTMAKRYQSYAELEDLEQEGYLALYDAVDGYDPGSGYKFLTYFQKWIRQYMIRYVQNNNGVVRIPVHEREKIREYNKVVNSYNTYLGRKPTRREIADNMGISDNAVALIEKAVTISKAESLNACLWDDENDVIGDMVAGDVNIEEDVLEKVQQEQLKAVIWPLVDELPEQQRQVLNQRYREGRKLKIIGESMGISADHVKRIEQKALMSMYRSRKKNLLKAYLSDVEVYNRGMMGNGVVRFNTTWTSSTERIAIQKYEEIQRIKRLEI